MVSMRARRSSRRVSVLFPHRYELTIDGAAAVQQFRYRPECRLVDRGSGALGSLDRTLRREVIITKRYIGEQLSHVSRVSLGPMNRVERGLVLFGGDAVHSHLEESAGFTYFFRCRGLRLYLGTAGCALVANLALSLRSLTRSPFP